MDLKLKGRTVIITGGTKGIGAGISTVMAEEGCNVIVNYRSGCRDAERFAKELSRRHGIQTAAVCADVSTEAGAEAVFAETLRQFDQIDILVNNAAGGYIPTAFQDITAEEWRRAGEALLDPAFYMSRAFLRHCLERDGGGHIVNLLSKSAILSGSVNNLAYVANKGALTAMTRGMAKEFIPYGIYVNGIVPGYVKTERMHTEGDPRTERVRGLLPTGRFAEPREIGNLAAALVSPLFGQMIGAVVDCTGGTLI